MRKRERETEKESARGKTMWMMWARRARPRANRATGRNAKEKERVEVRGGQEGGTEGERRRGERQRG